MSRKPIDRQQPTECRQAIWNWICKQGEGEAFSSTDIDVRLDSSSIREYVNALHLAGYLELVHRGRRGEANSYRLVNHCGAEAPRLRKDGTAVTQGQGRWQIWNTMRIIKQFSPTDLAFNASTDEHRVSVAEAKSYCQALCKAGYLRVAVAHKTGRAATVYALVPAMWTGPLPPQIQRTRQVYDPNLQRVVWSKVSGGAE